MMNDNKITQVFEKPVRVRDCDDVWITGRSFTSDGRFLRNIYHYGKKPTSPKPHHKQRVI